MSKAVTPGRRLFSELRRRRLFRTAALYIVGTWLVLQVADVVLPALDIPEQAIRYLLVAAVLGFPVALIFSWFYDVGLHGEARAELEKSRNADGDFRNRLTYGMMALLTAAEGKTEETEILIRRWRRGAVNDKTELAAFHHDSCRMLGMAHATTSAIECIRTGLVEPSYVIPFIEPFLPYYDSIRDAPEFAELLADLDDAANDP